MTERMTIDWQDSPSTIEGEREWFGYTAQDEFYADITWFQVLNVYVWKINARKGRANSLEQAKERAENVAWLLFEVMRVEALP